MKVDIIDDNTLYCAELGITEKGKTPSAALCRKILEIVPDIQDDKLDVHRDGRLSYTVNSIRNWSKLSISDTDKGFILFKYKEFNWNAPS